MPHRVQTEQKVRVAAEIQRRYGEHMTPYRLARTRAATSESTIRRRDVQRACTTATPAATVAQTSVPVPV